MWVSYVNSEKCGILREKRNKRGTKMLHLFSLLFWLLLIPFCIGLIPVNFISPQKRNPILVFLSGYFLMWALFEVVCIPAVLLIKYHNFSAASNVFMVLACVCAIGGLLLWYRNRKTGRESLIWGKKKTEGNKVTRWNYKAEWIVFLALVGFQLYKSVAYASFDGDDAYYVVESLIAQQADVMYRILPYTGRPTDLDVRHVLAVFPMWIAFVAVRSDIHSTILSHVVMPLALIPLTYFVYYEIGKRLFVRTDGAGSKENLPIFMILMALFQIFGNVSIYTNETFFLTRTWQGKAVVGSLIIPAVLWLMLWIYDEIRKQQKADIGLWFLLVCVNMSAGICSSIAVFLVSFLIALTAFVFMIAERDFKMLLRFGAACVPNIVYVGLYLAIGRGVFLG